MEKFRNLPNNIFFKFFLGMLLSTFIFFGVTDLILGVGKNNVAKVGNKSISIGKFYGLLNKERNLLIKNNPEGIDSNYINSKEFRMEILHREINSMLLKQASEELYIIPKDEVTIEYIISNPSFADSNGDFDQARFNSFLRNLGFNEKDYVSYLKDILTNRILISAIANMEMINDSLAEKIYRNRAEQRKVDIIIISEDSLNDSVKMPTKNEIKNFYRTNTKLFYRSEFRKVSYLEMDPDKIFTEKELQVTDEEVKQEYELRKSEYVEPETRSIYFMKTVTEQEINSAKARLEGGESFLSVAKDVTGVSEAELGIENVTINSFDSELANKIFDINENEYTDVIPRNGEFYMVYVYDIKLAKQRAFKNVKGEVKGYLLAQKREDLFTNYIKESEDKLLLADTIEEIAKTLDLEVHEVEKFNTKGLGVDGVAVSEASEINNFNTFTFELNEKTFSDLIFDNNNKSYVLFLEEIEEEGVLDFEDAKAEIKEIMLKNRKDDMVKELAENVRKQLNGTKNTFMVTMRNNLELKKNVTTARNNPQYSNEFLDTVFATNSENYITNAYREEQGIYKIAILNQIMKVEEVTEENISTVKREYNSSIYEDITLKYMEYLRAKIGASINSRNLQQLD